MAPSSVPEAEDEFFSSNVASDAEVDSSNAKIQNALNDLRGIVKNLKNKQKTGGFSAHAAIEIERDISCLKRRVQHHLNSYDFEVLPLYIQIIKIKSLKNL